VAAEVLCSGLGCSTVGFDCLVCSCVVVGFGSWSGNDGDLGWGKDKNSSVMVACRVWMGL
jgi:hypothetical protein